MNHLELQCFDGFHTKLNTRHVVAFLGPGAKLREKSRGIGHKRFDAIHQLHQNPLPGVIEGNKIRFWDELCFFGMNPKNLLKNQYRKGGKIKT